MAPSSWRVACCADRALSIRGIRAADGADPPPALHSYSLARGQAPGGGVLGLPQTAGISGLSWCADGTCLAAVAQGKTRQDSPTRESLLKFLLLSRFLQTDPDLLQGRRVHVHRDHLLPPLSPRLGLFPSFHHQEGPAGLRRQEGGALRHRQEKAQQGVQREIGGCR